jgi:hypothetical protein
MKVCVVGGPGNIYAELEKLELAMSNRFSYYLVARFFQIVARKLVQ